MVFSIEIWEFAHFNRFRSHFESFYLKTGHSKCSIIHILIFMINQQEILLDGVISWYKHKSLSSSAVVKCRSVLQLSPSLFSLQITGSSQTTEKWLICMQTNSDFHWLCHWICLTFSFGICLYRRCRCRCRRCCWFCSIIDVSFRNSTRILVLWFIWF